MNEADRDKLDVINAILPVMTELRRFYELQFDEGMKVLEGVSGKDYVECFKMISKESEKTSRKMHSLSGISWWLIDQVCESLGLAYHEAIQDGHGDS